MIFYKFFPSFILYFFFFFSSRRRHTRCGRDWSSDVCSSDLFLRGVAISIMPLGLGALRRSRDIALAMELRGFNYAETVGARRTVFRDIRMRPRDYAVVAVSLLGLVAAVGLSVLLGAFPEIPRAWLVFLSILLVLFSAIAWRISRTIKG